MQTDPATRPLQPLLRLRTFGSLELTAREDAPGDAASPRFLPIAAGRLNGRATFQALTLLKMLLCQPERRLLRDQALEWLWPEQSYERAASRLDDAASALRVLLRPVSGDTVLSLLHGRHGVGNGYQLAPYPQVWVDADAFHWYIEQACRADRFGDDALPWWEQAYRLAARGPFLADDLYSEWSKERRIDLSGGYKQCVHELARLYRERGVKVETERVLREHVARDPRDEDGLRPLMELLGEQERYQEALACYAREGGVSGGWL